MKNAIAEARAFLLCLAVVIVLGTIYAVDWTIEKLAGWTRKGP